MPDPQTILLWVISLPAAIALVATLVSLIPWRREAAGQPWGPALAICAGFAATFVTLKGLRGGGFPPGDVQHWLVYLGVPVVLSAVLATVWAKHARWVTLEGGVVLAILTVWLLTRPLARRVEPPEYWRQFAIFCGAFVCWFTLTEALAARVRGFAIPLLLALCAGVAALVLVNAHSLLLGQLAGAVAATLGAITVLAFWFQNLSLARGGVAALTVVLLGVILCGHLFADLTTGELALLFAAPLMAWAGELQFLKRGGVRFAVRLIAVLLVLAIPLVPALKGLRETMQEQTDSYSY
jgi:hypothetical protein